MKINLSKNKVRNNVTAAVTTQPGGAADKNLLQGFNILLVDDIEANQLLAKIILERQGATVTIAWNGLEAVKKMEGQRFDIVLMDLQMPVMDGLEATRKIRVEDKETPIIAITANTISGEPEKCREVGMNGFLAKPYKEKELLELVYQSLNITYTKIAESKEQPSTVVGKLYSLASLKSISQGNDAFIDEMVEIFVADSQETASDLQAALDNNDMKALKSHAHKIKPSLETFEIPFYTEIRRMEVLTQFEGTQTELQRLITQFTMLVTDVIRQMKMNNHLKKDIA